MLYRNVMLIDDDEDDKEIFVAALRAVSKEIDCIPLADPIEALEKLTSKKLSPEVIFLDLNMPVMSGLEFLKKIKADDTIKEIPVIIFSTTANPITIRLTRELGASHFITKPDKFDDLVNVLKYLT